MPPIGAMAFTPDGSRLWTVSHAAIEIRSWPGLSLVASVPPSLPIPPRVHDGMPADFRQSLAFHPAGRIAALAVRSGVWLLGSDGRPLGQPAIPLTCEALGVAFDENGRVLIATSTGMLAAGPDGKAAPFGGRPVPALTEWIWRAAIFPAARMTLYCVNDGHAEMLSWDTGIVLPETIFDRRVFGDPDDDGDPSSWLAADIAPGERAFVCGRKSGLTWVVHMRGAAFERAIEIEKAHVRREANLKLPMRTTAHAIHPTEDALVYAEISGFVGHARLSTGAHVRELPRAGIGYAWA